MRACLACAAIAAVAWMTPASAQPDQRAGDRVAAANLLPPHEIVTIIRSTGFDPIGRPARRGANYVLHAMDESDREVRLLIKGRTGAILSVTPIAITSRHAPRGVTAGPYVPMPAPGYIPPQPDLEPELPMIDGRDTDAFSGLRPPAPIPQSGVGGGLAPPATRGIAPRTPGGPVSEPRVITAGEPPASGPLPPPPERFTLRATPSNLAKPVRAAAATRQPPLPRPRPDSRGVSQPTASSMDASPIPPPIPDDAIPAADVPH